MLPRLAHRARQLTKQALGRRAVARLPRRVDLPVSAFGLVADPSGRLGVGDADLLDLVAEFGTPLHVVDGTRLGAAAEQAMGPHHNGAGCDVFYSYKTNPVPGVLSRMHAAGIGAETISPYELWLASHLGVPPERTIYNGPAKSSSSIQQAVSAGIKLINANSAGDAAAIARIAAECGRVQPMGIRLSLPGMWGGQFGLAADSPMVDRVVADANKHGHVDLCAIHVHGGYTIRTADDVRSHVTNVMDHIAALHVRTGWHPRIVDIGGGFACATVASLSGRARRLNRALGADLIPPDPAITVDLATASRIAAEIVRARAAERGVADVEVIIEPGRALTANTQMLITAVIDVKYDNGLPHAVLDAGINIAEPTPNEYHQLFSVTNHAAAHNRHYRLAGPICTPADVLYSDWRLPELDVGHVLAIMDTGAYYVPFSTSFSFPQPPIVLVDAGGPQLIRSRETYDHLVQRDRWS